ncbi:hypothetical protein PLCT2_02884 [Planctomycetaceae bacterium]|nr:hypothetical protein PLCT2_02884 [Planctomycetaceae bacterium]
MPRRKAAPGSTVKGRTQTAPRVNAGCSTHALPLTHGKGVCHRDHWGKTGTQGKDKALGLEAPTAPRVNAGSISTALPQTHGNGNPQMAQMTQITAKSFATEDTEITENSQGIEFRGNGYRPACNRGMLFVSNGNCTPPLQAGLWGSLRAEVRHTRAARCVCPAMAGWAGNMPRATG